MIPIRDFQTTIQELSDTIGGIDHQHLVADDNQATKKIGSHPGTHLVAVIPSSERSGRPGRSIDDNAAMFFIVRKPKAGQTNDEELKLYEDTQALIEALKAQIIDRQEDGCSVFFRLEITSIHIDPEYNIFGGYSGWSMSLVF